MLAFHDLFLGVLTMDGGVSSFKVQFWILAEDLTLNVFKTGVESIEENMDSEACYGRVEVEDALESSLPRMYSDHQSLGRWLPVLYSR